MIITNKYKIDDLVVKAVQSDYKYTDGRYSVTSILTDYKDIILKRRHHDEMVRDVSEMAWLMFGTAFHEFMEKQEVEWVEVSHSVFKCLGQFARDTKTIWQDDNHNEDMFPHYFIKPKLKEEHLIYKCKNSNYTLTGYSDLYNLMTCKVTDYKTASVNKVLYQNWDDYIKQLRLYAMILTSMGYPCNRGELIVFLKDWSQSAYEKDPKKYPHSPIYVIGWDFSYEDINDERQWVEDYFMKLEIIEQLKDEEIEICNEEVRTFGRKPTFAVMKNDNKRATKVCDTEQEAWEYIRYNKLDQGKDKYKVVPRPAEDQRCMKYCDSCHWCGHYINNYAKCVLVSDGKVMGFKNEYEANEWLNAMKPKEEYKLIKIERKEEKEND